MKVVPHLQHRFSIVAEVGPWVEVGQVDQQDLIFVPITGGHIVGDIEGTVIPGGGDWARIAPGDVVHVEARYLVQTSTGAVVDVVNTGLAIFENGIASPPGYFATRPVFRTSDPELEWLNRTVFVGWARPEEDTTTIDVYEVLPN